MTRRRRTPQEAALALARELDRKDDWPEDLEPGEVAWLLRELVKLTKEVKTETRKENP